jgi:hypothetical protein
MGTPKLFGLTAGILLVCATASAQTLVAKWAGPSSCGSWTSGLTVGKAGAVSRDDSSLDNALMLNWILGFLSGDRTEVLRDVDVPSVSSWLDKYCSTNPLASMPEAAVALKNDIIKRRKTAN